MRGRFSTLAGGWMCLLSLERSRSGNGGHVWFFFEEAIPASLARKLGSHILTETMEPGRKLVLIPTTGCFPIRTRCPKAGSEI
jgi:hypothetical protein